MIVIDISAFSDELIKIADKTRYLHDPSDRSDPDGQMTKSQLSHISDIARRLDGMMAGDDELPGWVPQHISVAQENLEQVLSYISPRAKTSSVMDKIARCWEGYEPVPGKKAYSDGSCRPIGSKSKKASVEYHGHTFPGYNEPIPSSDPEKKMMVLAKKGDDIKLIHFGQKGYKHNYSDEAKKDYLSRSAGIRNKSGELTKDDKFSANYWARRVLWPKGETGHGKNGPVAT